MDIRLRCCGFLELLRFFTALLELYNLARYGHHLWYSMRFFFYLVARYIAAELF